MSRRIFQDIEEALEREMRRISFHEVRTVDDETTTMLQETFDPFTGELVEMPIESSFYDSSADTGAIQYPHIFIQLLKTREDKFTNRVVPQYGKWCMTPVLTSPKAFEIVVSGSDGQILAPTSSLTTSLFKINQILPGHLIRLVNGNNQGTYTVLSTTIDPLGDHLITVSNTLITSLPAFIFTTATRTIMFNDPTDLNTLVVGDTFTDSLASTYNIVTIDINTNSITIDGATAPDTSIGGTIDRIGDMFTNIDPSLVKYIIMDSSKPIIGLGVGGAQEITDTSIGTSPEVPLDAFYKITIDSNERKNHIDILNRVWEEFNPPRTALPVIKRTTLSGEELLTEDVTAGGSDTLTIGDNSEFNIGDTVHVFDDLLPTKDGCGKFPEPFKSEIIELIGNDKIRLMDIVPDTFTLQNCTKVVSNAEFRLFMFHFVDHITKDNEGSQYWVHEFSFWVQLWVDRLEDAKENGVILDTESQIENITDGHIFDTFN